jgi:hypothetical protein
MEVAVGEHFAAQRGKHFASVHAEVSLAGAAWFEPHTLYKICAYYDSYVADVASAWAFLKCIFPLAAAAHTRVQSTTLEGLGESAPMLPVAGVRMPHKVATTVGPRGALRRCTLLQCARRYRQCAESTTWHRAGSAFWRHAPRAQPIHANTTQPSGTRST